MKNEVIKQKHYNLVKFHSYKLHMSLLMLHSYKSLEDMHDVMQ